MNEATITAIIAELEDRVIGRRFGKIFALSKTSFAVDLRPHDGAYLFVSCAPSDARIHLIERSLKSLQKRETTAGTFFQLLRKYLSNGAFQSIRKLPGERVVEFHIESRDEAGLDTGYVLIIQLTGRSSNTFLLNGEGLILSSLRENFGEGQTIGDVYSPPPRPASPAVTGLKPLQATDGLSLSETLDKHYRRLKKERDFHDLAARAKAAVSKKLKKQKKLKKHLTGDLAKHGDPERWKRLGDIFNANISTYKREGGIVRLIDYFDSELPEIEFELDENESVKQAAERYFKKFNKARAARKEIKARLVQIDAGISELESSLEELESAVERGDSEFLRSVAPTRKTVRTDRAGKRTDSISKFVRQFTSSDGCTILVGKRSQDNDHLTFRIAKSLDIWMHAADYPGSHVVVRKKHRDEEVPYRTLVEAARLAAFYSKARDESKAAVHYTERKFVSKPKGAAAGLVRLSSFKTIMVEPGIPEFSATPD